MDFKPFVKAKEIYKTFGDDIDFTIKMSGTITVALLIIYAIFALILNQIRGLTIGFFDYFILLLCVCLILSLLSPFIYSFFAINGGLHTKAKEKIKYTSFLKTYMLGTRPPFSGQLRVWSTLLKAICFYILAEALINIIVMIIAQIPGNELSTMYSEIFAILGTNYQDANEMLTAFESVILNHESLINLITIVTNYFALIGALYYFLHTISRNTFKYYLATSLGMKAPKQVTEFIFVKTLRKNRKDYNLNYYSVCFPLTIILVASFTLSYFLLGFLGPSSMGVTILSLTSIVISIALCLPFLPIVFNFHEKLWDKYSMLFMGTFLENAKQEVEAYKRDSQMAARIGEENLKRAEGSLDNIKDQIIKDLVENKGYEESDFEGLTFEEIYQNIGENEDYKPYKNKMERLKKDNQVVDAPSNDSRQDEESEKKQ